jgi:zinc protease
MSIRQISLHLLVATVLLLGAASRAQTLPAGVEKLSERSGIGHYRLKSNGLEVILAKNSAAPVATFMVVYKVGSRNETTGNTGSAHLLEHMLFNKTSENFGKAKGQTMMEALYEAGATFDKTNAATYTDATNYYDTLPSDKLELSIKIEAERMCRALILDNERQSEMTVVRNEYEISENDAFSALYKAMISTAFWAHPYHHDVLGWRSDIEGVTTEKLRAHYRTYYRPNNAVVLVVGDFEASHALGLIDRYFGSIPPSTRPIPQIYTTEPPQQGERRVIVRRAGQVGWVGVSYRRPGASDPDFYVTEVISTLLGEGITARLSQAVIEKQLATHVESLNYTLRDPFLLMLFANPAQSVDYARVEDAMIAEAERLRNEPIPADELERARTKVEAHVAFSRDGTYKFADKLSEAVAVADWQWFLDYPANIRKVTASDIQRVAQKYLKRDNMTVGWFIPTEGEGSNDGGKSASPAAHATGGGMLSQSAAEATSASVYSQQAAAHVPDHPNADAELKRRTIRRQLRSGTIVDVLENRMTPTGALRGYIRVGSYLDPPSKPGLAEVTSLMLSRGTMKRTKLELAGMIEGVGATLSFDAGTFDVGISGYGMSKDLPMLIDLLSEMLTEPSFPPDELEKVKAQLKNRILERQDDTSERGHERLLQTVFDRSHPLYRPGADERLRALESITIDDVRQFWKQSYGGVSLVLVVAGDVSGREVIDHVERKLGSWSGGLARKDLNVPRADVQPAATTTIVMNDKANADIWLGNASRLTQSDPGYYPALIANAVLGGNSLTSRLGKRVRDAEGLTYGIRSRFWGPSIVDSPWAVSVSVAPANVARAISSIQEEIAKISVQGVTEREVEIEKSALIGRFKVALADNRGLAEQLATAEANGLGVDYLDRYPALVRAVTVDQVNAALRRHIPADRLIIVIAGDVNERKVGATR